MKQEITSEKIKKLELKKSMLNFKIFSLMKKQLFSLVILLAMVLVGGNAFGQTGITRTTPYAMVVGSVGHYQVADAGGATAATTWAWSVYDVASDAEAYATNGGTLCGATSYRFVTALDNLAGGTSNTNSVYINWLAAPAATYAVQCITTNGNCSTTRRYFVYIFDFTVDVVICNADGTTEYTAPRTDCNTWSGLVVGNDVNSINPFEGNPITQPHASYINATGGIAKITPTYFKVTIALVTPPAGFDLSDVKWRFQYSFPTATNMSIYTISQATANFTAEASGTHTVGGAAENAVYPVPAGNYVYIPAASGTPITQEYVFTVNTHNLLSQDNMIYTVRLDRVSLEFDVAAGTAYNDGAKIWTTYGSGEPLIGAANELSTTQTINMSPATNVIDFNN